MFGGLAVSVQCFWLSYATALLIELARRRWENGFTKWGGWIAIAAGMVAHTIYLVSRSQRTDLAPLMASPHDYLLVLAWLLVATLLVLARALPQLSLGTYLLPPAIGVVTVASFVDAVPDEPLRENYWWVFTHSAVIVVGLLGIVLAFVASMMYLAQHRRLKARQPMALGARLPDLETLARWNWWCVVVSVPLITVGFAMGATLSIAEPQSGQVVPLLSMPIIVMLLLWLGMVGLLVSMLLRSRTGGTAVAIRTAWASGFVLSTILALTLLAPEGGLHGTGERPGPQTADADAEAT